MHHKYVEAKRPPLVGKIREVVPAQRIRLKKSWCECFKSCKDFLFQMFSSCNKNGINLSELELLGARPEEAGGMFDWDEGDRFSFEDSDRFEEDSLCSWISEPESSCNNWRGWKKQNGNNCGTYHLSHSKNKGNF
ncbi:zinc finger SWIM domain-containing protein 8 [Trichonephila clavipes]|nr:zinc finger SWIM domain-containing protein 8 [Trichonephila clavipes]